MCHCHLPSCLTCLGGIDDEIITEGGQPPPLGYVVRLHGFIVCLNTGVSSLCLLKNKNTNYSNTPQTPGAPNQSPNKLVSPQETEISAEATEVGCRPRRPPGIPWTVGQPLETAHISLRCEAPWPTS